MKKLMLVATIMAVGGGFQITEAANPPIKYALFNTPFKPDKLFLCRQYGCSADESNSGSEGSWFINDGTGFTKFIIVNVKSIKSVLLVVDFNNNKIPLPLINEQFNKLTGVKNNWLRTCIEYNGQGPAPKPKEVVDGIKFSCSYINADDGTKVAFLGATIR